VLAREHGHPSWPALVLALQADAESFVRAATEGRRARAEALLGARPEIEADPWARLVLGRGWSGDPVAPGGPLGWAPLLYVTHSVFAPVDLARDLLARGADPDSSFRNRYGAMSALYGASGVVHDPAMTLLLLEAGANPDDDESVYHAATAPDPTCLRLLLEHGANPVGTNALGSVLDEERPEHLRLLLEHGADPQEGATLAHAVRRGRSADVLELLIAHGADLEREGGETWRGDVPLRTPYANAALRARDDLTATLAAHGADTTVAPEDLAVARLARGEDPGDELPAALDVDQQEVVVVAALSGLADHVIRHVGPDFRGVVGGSPEGTLLHHAAWMGDTPLVTLLLDRGADPRAPSGAEFDTPAAWAVLASHVAGGPDRDHVGTVEALLTAGAELQPRFAEVADGELAAWLEAREP
jgi:ankyrin repeat protein